MTHTCERTIMHKGEPRTILFDEADAEIANEKWSIVRVARTALYVARGTPLVYLHRVLLGLVPGDVRTCDHINGNGLDNRRSNLRIATRSEQQRNRGKSCAGSNTYKGTTKRGARWYAQIEASGTKHWLGAFDTEIEAALAYNAAALRLHGKFARLNVIPTEVIA